MGVALSEPAAREALVEAGRRLYQRQMVAANDGNLSIRLGAEEVLTTPTGVSKGYMTPEMMVVVDMSGRVLRGATRPSTEVQMHLAVYRARPDVAAIVHAHPAHATAFAVAGIEPDPRVLAEVVMSLGSIPIAEFQLPSTRDLAAVVQHYALYHDAILLANHGAITMGADLNTALFRMETLEHFARIYTIANSLGAPRPLSAPTVRALEELRDFYGIRTAPASRAAGATPDPPTDDLDRRVREIARQVLDRLSRLQGSGTGESR
jgi:L-fuculose-phosphate aldolase